MRKYGGWQPEKTGFLFSFNIPQLTLLSIGVLIVVMDISYGYDLIVTLPISLFILGILFFIAYFRIYTIPIMDWVSLGIKFFIYKRNKYSSFDTKTGYTYPTYFNKIDILDSNVGVIYNKIKGTYTAVAEVTHVGLLLAEQERAIARIENWANFLNSFCIENTAVDKISIFQNYTIDNNNSLKEWLKNNRSSEEPLQSFNIIDGLLGGNSYNSYSSITTYITFTATIDKLSSYNIRTEEERIKKFLILLQSIESLLGNAEIIFKKWLDKDDILAFVDDKFKKDGSDIVLEPCWNHLKINNKYSAVTYEVKLPEEDVEYDILTKAFPINSITTNRYLNINYKIYKPSVGKRKIRTLRTKHISNISLRERTGQIMSEDDILKSSRTIAQDIQRAEGNQIVGTSILVGFICNNKYLGEAMSDIESTASKCLLELTNLYGRQDVGFYTAQLLGIGDEL